MQLAEDKEKETTTANVVEGGWIECLQKMPAIQGNLAVNTC